MAGGKGKEKPGAKEKQLAARKSVAKEKRPLKVGTVSNLYAQAADGTSKMIGRKRHRSAAKDSSARRGRPSTTTHARGGKAPRARLSSPVPEASSSESEKEERPGEPEVEEESEEEELSQESEDDYQDWRLEESEDEELPQESEEDEDEDAVADEDLLTAHPLPLIGILRDRKPYLRGLSTMPPRECNGLLDVGGDGTFNVVASTKKRLPSGVLGCLIKHLYPGLIDLKKDGIATGQRVPAWSWAHFTMVPDSTFDHLGNRLITEFWDYFTLVEGEGKEEAAKQVLIKMAKKLIPDQLYEARVRCVVQFYAEQMHRVVSKKEARPVHLSKAQYMKVIPQWLAAQKPCYKKIVDKWVSDAFRRHHKEASDRRKLVGGTHRQGPLSLDGVIAHKEKKEGRKLTKMQAFIETRRPKVLEPNKPLEDQWISTTAGNQKVNYCSKFKEIHGETFDPLTAPFDPMVAMCAGQGKLNGRPYIGGACFDSSGTGGSLAEMRARRTSSAPVIERRPRVGLERLAALEAELEKARTAAAEATARAQATEQRAHATDEKVVQMQTYLQALVARLPANPSLPPLPPLAPLLLDNRSAGSHTPADGEGGNGGDIENGVDGGESPTSAPSTSNRPE